MESAGFSGGRFVPEETDNGTLYSPHYFLTDHLGSVRGVVDAAGEVIERNDYYPFGMRWNDSASQFSDNRYRYNGKEDQDFLEVPYIDYGARMYDPKYRLSWGGVDPLADECMGVSPYVFCLNNSINAIDPNGCSTWVMANEDGTYRVVGGDLNDKDRNIYVYSIQEDNLVRGSSIGVTTSLTSFYNSDKDGGTWATGSIINPNDSSGSTFLENIVVNNPTMFDDYIANAGIYSSARDIGNIAAGYIAGSNGMPWTMSRLAFDAYQSKVNQKFDREGISTQNAEYYGWRLGNSLPAKQKLLLYGRSVATPVLKAEYRIFQKIYK